MANMTIWEPKRDLLSLREAMDQLFEESFVRPLGALLPARMPGEGMLTLTLPKAEQVKPQRLAVKTK